MDGWLEQEEGRISGERRSRQRYALKLPLEYRTIQGQTPMNGCGSTRDLSTLGISFEAGAELQPASQMELSIEWPMIVEGIVPPRLMVRGVVTRCRDGLAVIQVRRMQFVGARRMAAGQMPGLP